MRWILCAALLCAALAAVSLSGCGITDAFVYGSISGTVYNANNGSAINAADVTVRMGDTVVTATSTDSGGHYRVLDLQPGTYSLTASKSGFFSETITVTVEATTDASGKDFTLRPII